MNPTPYIPLIIGSGFFSYPLPFLNLDPHFFGCTLQSFKSFPNDIFLSSFLHLPLQLLHPFATPPLNSPAKLPRLTLPHPLLVPIGKIRRGDGNDVTPNPEKLNRIGRELDRLNNAITMLNDTNNDQVCII